MAYVKDVYVPYIESTIERLRAADPSACRPFGEQVCVLVVDCWVGLVGPTLSHLALRQLPLVQYGEGSEEWQP